MNFKYYLRGLGTGIIVTLVIVTISNSVRGKQSASQENIQPSSVQQTSALEAILNNQKTTQAETDTYKENETANDGSTAEPESAVMTSQGIQAAENRAPETTPEETAASETPAWIVSTDEKNITVSFSSIRSSESAAQLLEKAGVIDNWRNFNAYLVNNGYDRKVSGGTFSFNGDESYEEIARRITNSK